VDGYTPGAVSGTSAKLIADPTTFYVEPTWMANDNFGIYVKGGATRVTVQPKEAADSANLVSSTYRNKDVWGIMTGIGAKAYYNNFFIKAEYVEREFETYSFTSTTGEKNTITADIDTEETRIAIGYNF
jgi:opacity protein-like surface antigen